MLKTTGGMILPTAITGSYPRPLWFDRSLDGRSFKAALGDSLFREQYLDAVAAIINAQEAAGLDIVTDGDSRFDLVVEAAIEPQRARVGPSDRGRQDHVASSFQHRRTPKNNSLPQRLPRFRRVREGLSSHCVLCAILCVLCGEALILREDCLGQ